MNTNYIVRNHNEKIIDVVHSIMNNKTGKAETATEHILIKLMQIGGIPTTSFKYDQNKVNSYFNQWIKGKEYDD